MVPYIYWLKNKTTGLKYIGVQYGKRCHPNNFWVTYFTSSTGVKSLIKLYGKEDFIFKILHRFENSNQAIEKEHKYLKIAVKRKDYINRYVHKAPSPLINSKRGIIGGNIQRKLGLGIHKQSHEERLEILARAHLSQEINKTNPLKHCDRQKQVERGKKGGPKNKGFIWLTDGINSIKYTAEMQKFLSVEEFLKINLNLRKGRPHKLSFTRPTPFATLTM